MQKAEAHCIGCMPPVRHAQGVKPAAEVDSVEFARAHRDISLQGGDRLPGFSDPVFLQATASADAPESVAWFEVRDAREARGLVVALGAGCSADRVVHAGRRATNLRPSPAPRAGGLQA